MAKDPKRPNQDHWFDIANQIGSDSADELDDYFAGAAAEPLESIDSILREVEGDTPESDESQNEVVMDLSGDVDQNEEVVDEPAFAGFDQDPDEADQSTVEAETKDPLDIDWGTPPKREYPKASKDESTEKTVDVSVPISSETTSRVDEEPKLSKQKKPASQPMRQNEQKPAADRSVDSWDLLANDLGIEKPWELEETIDEPELIEDEETVSEVSAASDVDTPGVQSFDSIFDTSSENADEDKLSEEAAHDVLSQMFAFGDPSQDKEPVSETRPFDVSEGEDESDPFAAKTLPDNDLGFDSFNSTQDNPPKNVEVDSEADDEEFIEFDVEALTDGEEAGRGRSRRRRGRRSNQNESTGRKEEDISDDREDRKSAAKEKPANRRSRRSKDKTGSADSNKWKEKQSDQRGEDRPAKKPAESKNQKKEQISSETDRKKKKIPTWGEAIDHLIDNNLAIRKKSNNSGKKRRRR